ncbi:MAG: hypothetical protein NZ846_04710 [Thermus sp.]|uniref:hypothetical protein n=1 Tax=unclassified Thermus TaxID=2619321 RepID=UPI000238931E|nr:MULTISPECIES: hypothetical protein [unclassified Thermus]AEV16619.1 hypothetical protein TCCBUS3UF1_15780 [Thermus sp. CCB_US3_UF1]MCS6869443.1 hypothetical protein [Thermus sp.]MCS7218259.1 hypothetical protein [Thermus sp.]MDW8016243.1 hypothetical protein [Thermus sp.]MDW8356745.1 hypothetical protein [Thermus sp.]
MKGFLWGLALGGLLGAGAAWMAREPGGEGGFPPLPVQLPQGEGACEPQVYLFLNGEFFRMLPMPGGEPRELFPVEPVPNPFGGS